MPRIAKFLTINECCIIFNKVIAMLDEAGLGFTPLSMDDRKNFINALTNCIWTLDPHMEKLRDRCFNVPILFEHLFGYNIPENHKHKASEINISQSSLMSLAGPKGS